MMADPNSTPLPQRRCTAAVSRGDADVSFPSNRDRGMCPITTKHIVIANPSQANTYFAMATKPPILQFSQISTVINLNVSIYVF